MPSTILDVFGLLGELSADDIFTKKLEVDANKVLVDERDDKEARLAQVYLQGEEELLRRTKGSLRLEDVRRQAGARAQGLDGEYQAFQMLFLPDPAQLLAVASALMRAYSDANRLLLGPRISAGLAASSLKATPWKDLDVSIAKGIPYQPQRMRTLAECGEVISAVFEGWYEKQRNWIGVRASSRLFKQAFEENERRHGFLPMSKNLLGLTPQGVMHEAKAKRLHELETETMTQARSIRSADLDLSRQAAQLQETVDALKETRGQLESVNKARSEFIDVVAHQFRTPLSTIRWNAELLGDGLADKKLDPEITDAIDTVRTKSVYLIETLDRVFAALDIETGKLVLDMKPAFLWEVVQDVHTQEAKEIERAGLVWKFQRSKEQLREIPMDKVKIQSVIKILVHNAITYSEPGGVITVIVGDSELDGKAYQVFSIKDAGIGIPQDEIEHVFDKFYRSASSKLKAADGTGLGLFIVKNFVEAHGGLIKIESEGAGMGTTISFALPVG